MAKTAERRKMVRRMEVLSLITRLEMLRDEFYRDGDKERSAFLTIQVKNMRSFRAGLGPNRKPAQTPLFDLGEPSTSEKK